MLAAYAYKQQMYNTHVMQKTHNTHIAVLYCAAVVFGGEAYYSRVVAIVRTVLFRAAHP